MAGGAGHETGGVPHEENAEVCVVYSFSSAGRDGRDAHACRVMSTLFTSDTQFILSGSDDGNVRLWKANAADMAHHYAHRPHQGTHSFTWATRHACERSTETATLHTAQQQQQDDQEKTEGDQFRDKFPSSPPRRRATVVIVLLTGYVCSLSLILLDAKFTNPPPTPLPSSWHVELEYSQHATYYTPTPRSFALPSSRSLRPAADRYHPISA